MENPAKLKGCKFAYGTIFGWNKTMTRMRKDTYVRSFKVGNHETS